MIERTKKYNWQESEVRECILKARSFNHLAKLLGVPRTVSGRLKQQVITLGLDYTHFIKSGHHFSDIENLKSRGAIKKNLIRNNILDYKCYKCGIVDWNNQEIILDLEHVDGNTNNNEISNLILLCPNCHSQTSTFKGRNKGKYQTLCNKVL